MNFCPDLTVLVPVRNEAPNIAPLLAEIASALDGRIVYEILYVDDGSTDATWTQLAAAKEMHPGLRIIRHAVNCGQSTAIRTGMKAARASWVVTMDGDGQNNPADIVRLLAARDQDGGADLHLVGGLRVKRQDNWVRRLSSRIANGVRSRLLDDRCPDTGCALKLIRRDAFLDWPYFDHMHRFLPALCRRHGGRAVYIPVDHRPRQAGVSNYGVGNRLWVGIVDLAGVIWLKRRTRLPELVRDGEQNV